MFQYYRVYISLLISFICYLVFYFANIHLLQHLNSASYGDIYSSIKILIIISSLSLAAKQAVMTRYKPQFERTHRQLHQLGLLSWLTMNIATSAILLALGVVLSYFLHAVASNEIFQSAFTEHPIHFILFFAPILLFCMISVSLGLSQSTLSNHTISILTIIPSVVITSVLVLAVQTIRPHPFSMLITYLVCQGLVFAVYFFITYQFNRSRFLAEYEPREHLHYYAQGDRFWLSTFSYQLSIGLSLLALEAFSSDYVVGQYALILLFAIAYYSLLSPLYTFLSSHLDMHIETGPDILHPLLKHITKIQLFAVLVLGILSTIASPYIQALTPKGQDNFSTLVVFSCFLFSICMLTAPALRILLHSRYAQLGQRLQLIQLLVTVLILISLIPQYGIVGAIIADTIPLIIIQLIAYYVCRYQLNIHPFPLK